MLELFKTYSIDEIIMFILLLALAVKGILDLYDYFKSRFRKPIDKENNQKEKEEEILNKLEEHEESIGECKKCLNKILNTINILIESDRDDIKS